MSNQTNQPTQATMTNERAKRKWNTRQMVIIAVFVALGLIASFIETPLIPTAPWMKYDPSGAISLISGFVFGPVTGIIVAVLSWVPRLLMSPVGAVMNILAALAMIAPAAYIYRRTHTIGGAVRGMAVGICCSVIVSIVANFVAVPLYFGGSPEQVMSLILPAILPFNVLKQLINCGITLLLYKTISKFIHGNTEDKAANLEARRKQAMAAAESIRS